MKWLVSLSMVFFLPLISLSQDGKKIFESNCAACHKIEGKLIGPELKGAKEKWEKAGEGELLYKWVQNSKALYESGESKMAQEIWDFDASIMPAQMVTNEEIDAIFEYVATGGEGAVKDTTTTPPDGINQEAGTDYASNANIFWALLVLGMFLVLGIIVVSSSVRSLVGSEYYQNKLKNKLKKGGNATLLAFFLLTSSQLIAAPTEGTEEIWFKFENYHIWIMLTVDIALFFAFIYVRSVFKGLVNEAKTEKELAKEEALEKERSISKILTKAVDLEDEDSVMMDHDYDGIRELDNDLPPWWVWSFYASIIFAVVYLLHFHVFKTGDLQHEEYTKSIELAEKEIDAYLAANAMNVDENTVVALESSSDIQAGKGIFKQYCVSCHKENGEGDIGPNLTDDFWIYGNEVKDLFKVVKYGAKNGMKSWKEELNPQQMQQVVSFILTLEYRDGKEPQGEYYGEDGEKEKAFELNDEQEVEAEELIDD